MRGGGFVPPAAPTADEGTELVMNRSTSLRSEEARRQAQSASLRAKQAQSAILKERAAALAVEAQKVGNLRALRLAREAEAKEADAKEAAGAAARETSEAKLPAAAARRSKRRADARVAVSDSTSDIPAGSGADDMERRR